MLTHIIEILGFLTGLLYLWWEYHADNRMWLVSLIMPAISMWIYFTKGLYADFAINIYYLVMAFYGYYAWTRGAKKSNTGEATLKAAGAGETPKDARKEGGETRASRPITHTPLWVCGVAVGATMILWWLLWWLLVSFTDSKVPVADAFTTALSIVGLWMMARKYAEQWWAWFVVDAVCTGLYLYKGLPFYCILYGIYTLVCIFGYRKWLRLMTAKQ